MDNQQVANIDNPFGSMQPVNAQQMGAVANSDMARSVQEVQGAMMIAKSFPRNPLEAMDRIMTACCRPTLADAALYSYSRGGTEITGPSIRLAEAIAQEWGNIQFGIRELSAENGSSTVEAFAWDMQSNTRQVKVFQVPHMRYSKNKGNTLLSDPRDIYELVANNGARRMRACILGVIPGDVVEAAVRQCEVTQANSVDIEPEAIKAMLEKFAEFGVTQELIEKRIQRRAEAINAPLMLTLRRIMRSMLDGMSKPSDHFDIAVTDTPVGPKTSPLADKLKDQAQEKPAPVKKSRNPKKEPEPQPEPEPTAAVEPEPAPAPAAEQGDPGPGQDASASVADTQQGGADLDDNFPWEEKPPEEKPVLTYAVVADAINRISSKESQQKAINLMSELIGAETGDRAAAFKDELGKLYRKKIAELNAANK
jgi:hypothetical protein